MADTPKKNGQTVFRADYRFPSDAPDDNQSQRTLLIVAPHFQRAAFKAVKNTKDGETLVSLSKQNDAVV